MDDEHLASRIRSVDLGVDLDIDRELADALPNAVDEGGVDPLAGRGSPAAVLDPDDEPATSGVGEGHAVLRELGPVRRATGDDPQRLVVEVLALVGARSSCHPRLPFREPGSA